MGEVVTKHSSYEWGEVVCKRIRGERYYFESYSEYEAMQRAEVFEGLWTGIGGVEEINYDAIPTKVACEGKAALVSYLFSVHLKSTEEIAELLSISPSTVEQYIGDVKAGRRL